LEEPSRISAISPIDNEAYYMFKNIFYFCSWYFENLKLIGSKVATALFCLEMTLSNERV